MTDPRIEIFAINFDVDAVVVGYMHVPTDLRVGGNVALQHQIRLDLGHPDYAEDAELLKHRARKMLANALQDFEESDPYDPEEEEDEDDERGMGE